MKKVLITTFLLCIAAKASAVPVTLILADELEVSDGKVCVYENEQRSVQVKIAASAQCRHTRTVDTEEE